MRYCLVPSFSTAIKAVFIILALIYPILIYVGLEVLDVRVIGLLSLVVMIVRAIFIPNIKNMQKWGVLSAGGLIAALVFVFNDPLYLQLYPVMMSALMFGIFTMSLITPPSVIETFARLHYKGGVLPASVVTYTRHVTKIWCGFFILNGLIAFWTIHQSMEIWTLYNGLISYLLMGVLFAGEFLFRHFIIKKRNSDV